MNRIHAIALLAAAAMALLGCDLEGGNGQDTILYALDATDAQALSDAVGSAAQGAAAQLEPIGYVDGNTGEYRFGSGLVIDPADILDVTADDLAAPKQCGATQECTEASGGIVPPGGWLEGSCWLFEEIHDGERTVCAGCCVDEGCFELCGAPTLP